MEQSVPRRERNLILTLMSAVALAVAGCAAPSKPAQRAPVVDRTAGATPTTSSAAALPPGAENAGKPGYYSVRPGDTLMRIGLETGQSWRDLAQWNGLTNPNLIEVGQVLRVVPPTSAAPAAATAPAEAGTATSAVSGSSVQGRPLDASPASATTNAAAAPKPASSDEVNFLWPTRGQVVDNFDEARYKGIGIAGRIGEPVLAAADGRVVYAGAGLRGYGNLVILKHNNTYLTAYAHNQTILVKEDQTVRQGQKIAEMGSSDSDRVKLHFEVRRQGKPVDPLKYLPAR